MLRGDSCGRTATTADERDTEPCKKFARSGRQLERS
jgi:hypothetical protein